MKMKKIEISYTKRTNYLYYLILTYFIIFMIFPFLILANFENSAIAVFLNSNMYLLFLIVLVFIYIIITGVYYSYFRVDSYIINVSSSSHCNKSSKNFSKKFNIKILTFKIKTVSFIPLN